MSIKKSIRVFIIASLFSLLYANALQDAIDRAKEGSILKLPKGVYKGSIVINKPLSIIGKESGVIIDGEGNGTVIKIKSSFVTLKNLTIVNSGTQHESLDGAIKVSDASQCEISNCNIKDTLFGIDLQMVKNSIVKDNNISSKDLELGLRGDGQLEVEIYRALLQRLAFGEAAALILVQTAVLALVSLGYLYAQRRLAVRTSAPAPPPGLGGARGWAAFALVAGFFTLLYAPLWALVLKSFWGPDGFSLAGWAALARPQASYFAPSAAQAIYNTLRFTLLALLVAAPLGFAYAYGVWKGARVLDLLGFLPLLVSPVSLAVGYLLAYPELRASLVLLVMAYALIAYPLFARTVLAAMRRLPPGLAEAARTLGAGPARVLWRVELPLLRPALGAAAALAAAVTIGEFGATLVLARPEWATLTVAIYERLGKPGIVNYQEAMALSVVLGLLAGGVFWGLGRGGEVG